MHFIEAYNININIVRILNNKFYFIYSCNLNNIYYRRLLMKDMDNVFTNKEELEYPLETDLVNIKVFR